MTRSPPVSRQCRFVSTPSSKIIVPSVAASISAAYKLQRLARGNRVSNRLPAIPAKTNGDPNSRHMQTQPSSELDPPTAGIANSPTEAGAGQTKNK